METFELRDPIHSRIPFNEFERSIIDHPFFQRLRFIQQLSFLQAYVYPGGVHDRFSHCLGSMYVAGRLFGRFIASSDVLSSRLSENEIAGLRKRVRIAGLLHDIGHGPFSHSSESVFPPLRDLPLEKSWWKEMPERQAKHEDYSVLLIQTMADEGIFDAEFAQDVSSLIHGSVKPSPAFEKIEQKAPTLQRILKSLISGEVDCDRMDYLLRDSYYCGVAYGQHDLDWLISSMGIGEEGGKLFFVISENGVRAYEDLLLARYHMIDQVYFHKTKAGFEYYLRQAIKTREIPLEIPADPYLYADMRDGKVIEMLFAAAKDEKNYWSHHLMKRIAAKRILRLQDTPEDIDILDKLKDLCESNGIRYFTHTSKTALSQFGERSETAGSVYVVKKTLQGVKYLPIFDYSDLLKKYNEKLKFTDFFVFREDFEEFEKLNKG